MTTIDTFTCFCGKTVLGMRACDSCLTGMTINTEDIDSYMTIVSIYNKPAWGLVADWDTDGGGATNPISVEAAAHQLGLWLKEYAAVAHFQQSGQKNVLMERIDTCKDALWDLGALDVIADVYGIDA